MKIKFEFERILDKMAKKNEYSLKKKERNHGASQHRDQFEGKRQIKNKI